MTERSSTFPPHSNTLEMSVSDLAFSLKRTVEENFGRVRVRGELSRVNIHGSGHMYSDLKDAGACINVVCWKGTLAKLSLRPEEGMDVVCTGRLSTYPARSNYQLIIESIELAGEGALLKLLEERRRKLAAEGLFEPGRKRPLPFLPRTIGVITSPTGAVLRDIMHRLNDRFPRPVLLWPVLVQGKGAAEQVAAAIQGFNALPAGPDRDGGESEAAGPAAFGEDLFGPGRAPAGPFRPDLLIVARGGGSLEDLMPFNEEIVVRAAAASRIPLISAIGHETDTTLIDYAADLRAPTPTGAAELAVPRRADLLAAVMDHARRLYTGAIRGQEGRGQRLSDLSARLADPFRALEYRMQRTDHLSHRLSAAFDKSLRGRLQRLTDRAARIVHPQALLDRKAHGLAAASSRAEGAFDRAWRRGRERLIGAAARLRDPAPALNERARHLARAAERLPLIGGRIVAERTERLARVGAMLEALSFKRTLARGFSLVRRADGSPVTAAENLSAGERVSIEFRDDGKAGAVIESVETGAPRARPPGSIE